MATRELRFFWWNLQDFAHFDANRPGYDGRWPFTAEQYAEKCRRVDAAFEAMCGADAPDVIGLCEITKAAAEGLRKRKFQNHLLILSEPSKPLAFQVALFIRRNTSLARRRPFIADDVSEETRPMCVALFEEPAVSILFVACHWTAFDTAMSRESRRRCADALRGGVYDFLVPRRATLTPRHVVAFGDFNAEPFDEMFESTLYASRDRDHARRSAQPSDGAVSRTRLYNCGWRLLGEGHPHGGPEPAERRVGTYYHEKSNRWRAYDQVLVSGGLLASQSPYFDESVLLVRTDMGNLVEGKPAKFAHDNGTSRGLSDHYPLTGRIILG